MYAFHSDRRFGLFSSFFIIGLLAAIVWAVGFGQKGYLVMGSEPGSSEGVSQVNQFEQAQKYFNEGNYKDALETYQKGFEKPLSDYPPQRINGAVFGLVNCFRQLNRTAEVDAALDSILALNEKNFYVLMAVSSVFKGYNLDSFGFWVDNQFKRGNNRSGGTHLNCQERDRIFGLYLMNQAYKTLQSGGVDLDSMEKAEFYYEYAKQFQNYREGFSAWRFQYLTDLKTRPEFPTPDSGTQNQGYGGRYHNYGSPASLAAVDENGQPVVYPIPDSFESATNDGERWRFLLNQSEQSMREHLKGQPKGYGGSFLYSASNQRAVFAQSQFGVQTLGGWSPQVIDESDDQTQQASKAGIYSLESLSDQETIAKLATGVKRFDLPDRYNYIKIWQEALADAIERDDYENTVSFHDKLANEYLNRRQYVKAAEHLKAIADRVGKQIGTESQAYKEALERYEQVVGNWGRFSGAVEQNGLIVAFPFVFRNATEVQFTAYSLNVDLLLDDVKSYLRNHKGQLDYDQMRTDNIGYQIVKKDQKKYRGPRVDQWVETLEPLSGHKDRQFTVERTAQKPGAYLIEAQVKDGNSMFAVIWVTDMVLVQKNVDGKVWYFTADAQTGDAVPHATVEFFGYKQNWERVGRQSKYDVETKEFLAATDENGQLLVEADKLSRDFQWLITAVGLQKQFAYMGFNNYWFSGRFSAGNDWPQAAVKAYSITNCPVYRPGTDVQFKFWLRTAQYDQDGNEFAGKKATVEIMDPQGEKILEQEIQFDEFAGCDGKLTLNKAAKLGVYQILLKYKRPQLKNNQERTAYAGSFRVEEYRKPEFSVKVDAPTEPIALGDSFKAKLQAKYYFGQPVTNATAKIKVVRSAYRNDWFPSASWDWLFGAGYWWRTFEYPDYPGWFRWGSACPKPSWFRFPDNPPEVVLEKEAALDKDGCAEIEIDSSVAKALFGNTNQKYEITAEVTDQSRRTIDGSGTVLVAAVPFKIYSWVDRGVYQTGDTLKATFQSRTLAGKPVAGKGLFKLYRVTYTGNGEAADSSGLVQPTETEVYRQEINPDEDGKAAVKLTVRQPGQYRTEYILDNGKKPEQIGGSLFTVRGRGFQSGDCRFTDLELIPDKETYQPGDSVRLTINVDQPDAVVWLFPRAVNGLCAAPQRVPISGKTGSVDLPVDQRDMPNFFVEAVTVGRNRVFSEARQICVPPEKRVLTLNILPSEKTYKPGEKATAKIELTDWNGKPFVGQTVVAVYDKSLEYIASRMDSGDIAPFFWSWKRSHRPQTTDSLKTYLEQVWEDDARTMAMLGMFGGVQNDKSGISDRQIMFATAGGADRGRGLMRMNAMAPAPTAAPAMAMSMNKSNMAMDMDAGVSSSLRADAAVFEKRKKLGNDKPGSGEMYSDQADADEQGALVEAQVRSKFADSAFWIAALTTDENGQAEIELTMPENLTTWVVKAWAMGKATEVGQAQTEVITQKNLILRAQTPRFMVQKDRIVLSANVHNYLATDKKVEIRLELGQKDAENKAENKADAAAESVLKLTDAAAEKSKQSKQSSQPNQSSQSSQSVKSITIPANGEMRIDWEVEATEAGKATVRMFALTDEESDAMEVQFPVVLYGFLKQDSFSGMIPAADTADSADGEKAENKAENKAEGNSGPVAVLPFEFRIPEASRALQNQLIVRFSPTLAGAMLDAIPYLIDYPYGCTEQTLNRFLPAAIARQTVRDMGVDLAELAKKPTNLNAQEIGDAKTRAAQYKKTDANPVFDETKMDEIVNDGLDALLSMRCSDGGWGWFSGYGEQSTVHTTAVVVHGLLIARQTGLNVQEKDVLPGIEWLKRYQAEQIQLLQNAEKDPKPKNWRWKSQADNADALVFRVLAEAKTILPTSNAIDGESPMVGFLMRDKTKLSTYGLALTGLGLNDLGLVGQRDQVIKNLSQYLHTDDENQTAWLDLGGAEYWFWYGSEIETQAAYLKLLCAAGDKTTSPRLVKYLLNNRKHATYWNSTRDTALVLEAFADYLKISGEMAPEMSVDVVLDSDVIKTVQIDRKNLFSFDGTAILTGSDLKPGVHKLELRRTGAGPLYANAYVTYFTMEDEIGAAGLEIRVDRKYYKLVRDESGKAAAVGSRGQALEVKTDAKKRVPLANGDTVESGDIILVDLTLESKNDYEYLLFEDRKPAGFEPVEVKSGYNGNELGAYVEFRDQKVAFFVRSLRRGRCSVSYQLRAETPGTVCALPASGEAMYAPELKGNSQQFRISTAETAETSER